MKKINFPNKKISGNLFFLAIIACFFFFCFSGMALAVSDNCTPTADPDDNDGCQYAGQKCIQVEIGGHEYWRCTRALEIVYPKIPGQDFVPESVASGVPEYFKYLFQLAVILIGIAIFGVFVYSGARYLTSAGNPSIMSDARTGMFSALLGAVILLGSYLIFNTVNPQLTVINLPTVGILEQAVRPGVYVCNYAYAGEFGALDDILKRYIEKTEDEQIEAAQELQKVIVNPQNRNQNCLYVNFSGNFQNLVVEDNYTMFVVPTIKFSLSDAGDEYTKKPIYEYGIILHEKDDFSGKCKIYPTPEAPVYSKVGADAEGRERIYDTVYYPGTDKDNPVSDYTVGDINFKSKSVTIFKRPQVEPASELKGLVTHMCIDFDRIGMCPEYLDETFVNEDGVPNYGNNPPSYKPSGDNDIIIASAAENDTHYEKGGMRSVKLDTPDFYFAVFRDNTNAEDANCVIMKQNNPDITTIRLEKAGDGCKARLWYTLWIVAVETEKCIPKIEDMVVVKGKVL